MEQRARLPTVRPVHAARRCVAEVLMDAACAGQPVVVRLGYGQSFADVYVGDARRVTAAGPNPGRLQRHASLKHLHRALSFAPGL